VATGLIWPSETIEEAQHVRLLKAPDRQAARCQDESFTPSGAVSRSDMIWFEFA